MIDDSSFFLIFNSIVFSRNLSNTDGFSEDFKPINVLPLSDDKPNFFFDPACISDFLS